MQLIHIKAEQGQWVPSEILSEWVDSWEAFCNEKKLKTTIDARF